VVTTLVFLNVLAVVWYVLPGGPNQWKNDVVPGKVVSVSSSTLITVDPRGTEKEFILTMDTKIFAGKDRVGIEQIQIGALVLVQLDTEAVTKNVADDIRIMTDKRKDKKQPQ
jgi:hypothetical protein